MTAMTWISSVSLATGSRGRLGILQSIFNGLRGARSALQHAPAVVVLSKSNARDVVQITGVQRGAYFVQRHPSPGEVDLGRTSLLADASNSNQFSSCDRNMK